MSETRQPSKAEVVRYLLENEGRVMLCLDATRTGVDVPRRFQHDSGLRLILNRTMPQPIHFTARAIESELRFGGIPHYCLIPYEALWGAFNPDTGHGMFWKESMPDAVRRNYERQSLFQPAGLPTGQEAKPAPAPPAAPAKAKGKGRAGAPKESRPVFHVIEGSGDQAGEQPAETGVPSPSPAKPFLRLVE